MKMVNSCYPCFLVVLILKHSASCSAEYYTAAVYEHVRQDDNSPDTRVQTNLEYYQIASAEAQNQGADMIVFPEYGLFPPVGRGELKQHLELIPNPKETEANPCIETDIYSDRPILHSLSCMAKENGIVVVANMGGIEHCGGQPDCPEDGDIHLNANVAFDKNGTILGRYYKERLFYEFGMDLPRQKQDPIFETDFGKFAMFTCFDIMWEKMAVTSRMADVNAVLFTTMWMVIFPFLMSISYFQAFAIGNNATLLAANVHMPGYLAVGSGIFRGSEGVMASTFNPDGISKLVVASIPKGNHINLPAPKIIAITKNVTEPYEDDVSDIPSICTYDVLGKAEHPLKDYRCMNEDVSNYTLKKLDNPSDHIEVCNNGICCELDYVADSMNESFYFGAYSGLHTFFSRYAWYEEDCFLARCDDFNGTVCSVSPMKSETVFRKIVMSTNFQSQFVYPSLVSSWIKLVPTKDWTFETKSNESSSIEFDNGSGIELLAATLMGRAYEKDPPYVR